MTKTKTTIGTIAAFFLMALSMQSYAQCGTFADSPKGEEAETAHVLYRQAVKADNLDEAYDNWLLAYTIAPGADGKRASHYVDGRKILKHKMKAEQDPAKKKELIAKVISLYDEEIVCYPKKAAFNKGRMSYDMFYEFRTDYPTLLRTLKEAVELGKNTSEYIIMVPYASASVYQFQKEQMDAETVRGIHQTLNDICDHNINNDSPSKVQYEQAKAAMNAEFAKVEKDIFDCEYFKTKLLPEFEANKTDGETVQKIYGLLVKRGCDKNDPGLAEIKTAYQTYASAFNADQKAEYERTHPAAAANRLYKEGNYAEALSMYNNAIASETDPNKQAEYYFSMASIEFRKNKSYSTARQHARKAEQLRPNWGKPAMLIGDMYASTSKSCGGNAWEQRLAIIAAMDKWGHAKAIDASLAEDAQSKLNKYYQHLPEATEGFMRKVTKGQRVKVPCWIGETVAMRFKS